MDYRDAISKDIEQIKTLLQECKLPANDVHEHIKNFIIAERNNKVIALGGFEKHNNIALIRSIAVAPAYQANGIGKAIYHRLENKIKDAGIKQLYLLTETASEYFKRLGFSALPRNDVPSTIKQTRQFKELCPASATVMFHTLLST